MAELVALVTVDKAARLSGLTTQQINRWVRQGTMTPRYDDDSGWLGVKRMYSFRDLVTLRILSKLNKEYGVAARELSRANAFLQERYEVPWESVTFYVLNHHLFFQEPKAEQRLSAERPEQLPLQFPLKPIITTMRKAVAESMRRRPEQIGHVTRNRLIMGNQFCLDGTRIPVGMIYSYHLNGSSDAEILREYPSLEPADVTEAIRYETERLQQLAEKRSRKSA
jgi:uncharacterized protein (DUF433 family)/DNA-binding transcriptional MerR regulator